MSGKFSSFGPWHLEFLHIFKTFFSKLLLHPFMDFTET